MADHSDLERIAELRPVEADQTMLVLDEKGRAEMLARIVATPHDTAPHVDRLQAHRRRTPTIAKIAAVGLAIAGSAFVISRTSPRTAPSPTAAGGVIKARLLSALDASNDVIEMKSISPGGHILDIWSNAAGTISHVTQTGYPESRTTVTTSGTTFVAMYPASKTWLSHSTSSTEPIGNMIPINDLRSRVQSGTLTVLATDVTLNGQNSTELLLTDPPLPSTANSYLWVNSSTDLPVQEKATSASNPAGGVTTWNYYSPDSAEAANLAMPVPADYTQVPVPAGNLIAPGGTLPIRIWNGTTEISGGAICPPAGESCLITPRTLPLPPAVTPVGSGGKSSGEPANS